MVTLTWHASKYKVHELHQRHIDKRSIHSKSRQGHICQFSLSLSLSFLTNMMTVFASWALPHQLNPKDYNTCQSCSTFMTVCLGWQSVTVWLCALVGSQWLCVLVGSQQLCALVGKCCDISKDRLHLIRSNFEQTNTKSQTGKCNSSCQNIKGSKWIPRLQK